MESTRSAITGTRPIEYLAGFFDGEGCVAYYGSPRVSMSNTYLPILKEFQERWGGSICEQKRKKEEAHYKPKWIWQLSGDNAVACARDLIPHLYEKRSQARLMLVMRTMKKTERDQYKPLMAALKRRQQPCAS